ncbi:MAG: hypothetical protein NUW01_05670 [Gemmatimonadaceae bacterium]|nr:hypothetical protein [Gemmatimonadaceae bacterium]
MSEDSARDSLPRFLAQRARTASDGRLAIDAAGGLIAVAAAAVVASPGNLVLAAVGTCFLAFGLWGITDRELAERRATIGPIGGGLLLTARAAAMVLGMVGGLALLFGGLAVMLGRWVS